VQDKIVSREFYETDVLSVARSLLGKLLVHCAPGGRASGMIVETEAYSAEGDPSCHAAQGKTKRNAVMFGPPGRAYVYFIYGNHYCFNVVTNRAGRAEAVLVRALEPVEGTAIMHQRRGKHHRIDNLTSGPGKLCAALGISGSENGISILEPPLYIAAYREIEAGVVGVSERIGISRGKEKPWRFFVRDNPFVSRMR